MANISTYPIGTPAAADLIPATQKFTDANGNKQNRTRNFTAQSLGSLINAGFTGGYTVYTALLTQEDGAAPVATVLQNTIGGTVTWTRPGTAGVYTATIVNGVFTANKTMVFINNGSASSTNNIEWASNTTTTVIIDTTVDTVLAAASIEIRVYN
tara:strand:- start:320 stop:784 length:465 start_codon:yes stop_codon:yes gene_type:complete